MPQAPGKRPGFLRQFVTSLRESPPRIPEDINAIDRALGLLGRLANGTLTEAGRMELEDLLGGCPGRDRVVQWQYHVTAFRAERLTPRRR
jgi:hypothetical protein